MIEKAADIIHSARYAVAFTGAGLSVECGLPLFGGWPEFDPRILDLNYFSQDPANSWQEIKRLLYDFYDSAQPGKGHQALSLMQEQGLLKSIITLNIDELHQKAGSEKVFEVCGTRRRLICLSCGAKYATDEIGLEHLPATCPACGGILKPEIQFYNDMVPDPEYKEGLKEANRARVLLVIGVSGQIIPAGFIPMLVKRKRRATIIEINTQKTRYTDEITDIFIQQPAARALEELLSALEIKNQDKVNGH